MTFREDESRLRERNLRENFAWLNRFALSLFKQHPGRQSLVMKRRSCGWSDTFLMEVVTDPLTPPSRGGESERTFAEPGTLTKTQAWFPFQVMGSGGKRGRGFGGK